MCENGKKSIWKLILKAVLVLAAIWLLVLLTIPLWIGPVVTGVSNAVVPKVTGTPFHMGTFAFNPYNGTVLVEDMTLSNPDGFGKPAAFSIKRFALDIAPMELLSKKVHVENLEIVDPFASYYSVNGTNNIDCILAHAKSFAGMDEQQDAAKKEEKPAEKQPAAEKKGSEIRFIIDRVYVGGTKVRLSGSDAFPLVIPMPTIELHDIGKDSDGATWDETWGSITESFSKSFKSIGDGVSAFGKLLGDGFGDASKQTGKALDATGEAAGKALDATTDAVKGVGDGAKKLFKDLGL